MKVMKNYQSWKRTAMSAFIMLMILIFSCEKKPDCYKCTTTFDITYKVESSFEKFSTSDTQEFCDMSEEEKAEYENLNTGTTTDESSGLTTITVRTTICTK